MKKITLILLLVSCGLYAQIPAGYYDHATGSGYTLKTQLKQIIDAVSDAAITGNQYQHTPQSYSSLWTLYPTSDDTVGGKVWDMYSNCDFTFGTDQDSGSGGTTECDKYNREHSFPRSWYGDGSSHPMKSDPFHVIPVDKKVNSDRGNLAYGEVNTSLSYTTPGTALKGTSNIAGPTGTVFEPHDDYKGDIARGLLYVAVRYEDEIAGWEANDSDGDSMLDGTSNKVFEQWAIDMLYSWHVNDPVSQKEIDRNNDIYNFQNNRNPFIDHPEWVAEIWQSVLATEDFSVSQSKLQMFPNPLSNDILTIKNAENTEVLVFDILGKQVFEKSILENTSKLNLSQLNSGMYFVQIGNKSNSVTKKLIKK